MNYPRARIIKLMIDYFDNDYRRIEHSLRVLYHCETIMTKYESYDLEILIASTILHDIGIKKSEQELGYNNGKTQEKYGPDIAEELLNSIEFPKAKIEIVKNIIGNHHSVSRYNYVELEILKQADKIVNRNEKNPIIPKIPKIGSGITEPKYSKRS